MHFDDPSDQADARLAVAAFIARTKLDMTDAFGTMEKEVKGDPVIFDQRSKKALDLYLADLPPQLPPEQRRFLRDELEEDRGLMLNGLRTAALDRARAGHNADLARVADRFAADAEAEARKLGFSGEVDGGFRALAVHQGLAKAELALFERTDLDDKLRQDFLTQAKSRAAEAAVSGTFEAHLAQGPDAAQQMIEDFRAMQAPEGIDKDTQEAITRRLGGRLRDARNKLELETMTAETEAVVERALTVTELSVGAGEGTAGHADVQAAALSPEQKSRLAVQVEARMAEERKRHDGRALMARFMAGETDDTDTLDPSNPDHQAAVDDYFQNIVLPNRVRVKGAASLIAATGMVPKGVNTILLKALSLPPDLGSDPKIGPSPSEQAIVATVLARIDGLAPGALDGIDPRIRARGELINQLIDGGGSPEQAALRAEALMAAETDDPFRPPIGDPDDPDEPPDEPEKKPKPDDGKKPPRDKGRCLEEWLDARAAIKRLDAMGAAIRFKQSQIEGFEAERRRLIKEIGLLRLDLFQGGVGTGRALARKNMRPLAAAKAAKAGAQSRKLKRKEADMRGVQRTIVELKEEKKKLADRKDDLEKDSDNLNALLKACQDKHGDKA